MTTEVLILMILSNWASFVLGLVVALIIVRWSDL